MVEIKKLKIISIVLVIIMAFSALQISVCASNFEQTTPSFFEQVASSAVDKVSSFFENTFGSIDQSHTAANNSQMTVLLVGVLYAFVPVLIVVDLISYFALGDALIAGRLLNL